MANDMTDIMENLDTRELDIGDGEEEFDGQDPGGTGKRNEDIKSDPHKILWIWEVADIFHVVLNFPCFIQYSTFNPSSTPPKPVQPLIPSLSFTKPVKLNTDHL